MRCLLCVFVVVCTIMCAAAILAGPVTDSVAFQGRLEDAVGNPVPDGLRDLTLSFWDDSVGGSMLHSELRTVDVQSGLYSTCVGCGSSSFFDIFTDQPIYLEVQLAGEPAMSPRIPLRYVPRSFLTGRVRGDLHTESGLLRVRHNLGSSGEDGVEVFTDNVSSRVLVACCLGSSGEDGVEIRADGTTNRLRLPNLGSSGQDGVEVRTTDTSSHIAMGNLGSSGEDGVEISVGSSERRLKVSNLGSSGEDGVEVRVDGSSSRLKVSNLGSSGQDGVSVVDSGGVSTMELARKRPGRVKYGNIVLRVTPDSVIDWRDVDSDDDGLSDSRMTTVVGHGGGGAGGSITIEADPDGDGSPEGRLASVISSAGTMVRAQSEFGVGPRQTTSIESTPDSATMRCVTDVNRDGIPDLMVVSSTDATSGRLAINTKGTGAKRLSAGGDCDDTDSEIYTDCDDDGDGVPETSVSQSSSSSGAMHVLYKKGINSPNLRQAITSLTDDTGALHRLVVDVDEDGVVDQSVSSSCDASSSKHAIKTKGTGAESNRVASSAYPDTAIHSVGMDSDGDGADDISVETRVGLGTAGSVIPGANVLASARNSSGTPVRGTNVGINETLPHTTLFVDDDGDGTPEVMAEAVASDKYVKNYGFRVEISGRSSSFGSQCDSSGVTSDLAMDNEGDGQIDQSVSAGVTPSVSMVAIKTKGTGADANRVIGSTDDTTATVLLATDSASVSIRAGKGGNVKGNVTINHASAMKINLGSDGVAYLDSALGIGVLAPSHPVEVAGGAFCDGTDWVNASDADSKENFESVSGEELLEKLSDLEITKWNYKGDAETVHIGPTAQDFKKVFGVGKDDKSISTIDPSGIALAAIKQLKKENDDLRRELDELKMVVQALTKK